jgi:GT2 family glycosyltransferase
MNLTDSSRKTRAESSHIAKAGSCDLKTVEIAASVVTYKSDAVQLCALLKALSSGSSPVHTIVVDNSPSDHLQTLVEACGATYTKQQRNLGYGRAHNKALNMSINSAKYHLVVNPDISLEGNVIDRLCCFMEGHPEVGLVMPKVLYPNGNEQGLCKLLPTPMDLIVRRFLGSAGTVLFREQCDRYEMRNLDLSVPREVPSLSGCFMFIRTEVLRKAGLFDERFFMYMEDVDLCRRIGRHAKTVFYPLVSVNHGYTKGSYRDLNLLYHHVQSAFRYFSKWAWFRDPEREQLNQRTDKIG